MQILLLLLLLILVQLKDPALLQSGREPREVSAAEGNHSWIDEQLFKGRKQLQVSLLSLSQRVAFTVPLNLTHGQSLCSSVGLPAAVSL